MRRDAGVLGFCDLTYTEHNVAHHLWERTSGQQGREQSVGLPAPLPGPDSIQFSASRDQAPNYHWLMGGSINECCGFPVDPSTVLSGQS